MPIMDGLELITKTRESDNDTQIVILSCLQEFDLVQKAMKLGVANYIAKLTMSPDEIYGVLKKVKDKLDKTKNNSSLEINKSTPLTNKHFQDLIQETLYNFLIYHIYSESNFYSTVRMKLHHEKMMLCILEIDHFEQFQKRFKDERGDLIRFSILNILNEILESYQTGVAIADTNKRYVLVFSFHNMKNSETSETCISALNGILEHIKRTLDTYLSVSVTISASNLYNEYDNLVKMYDACLEALKYKFILDTDCIISSDSVNTDYLQNTKVQKLNVLADNNKKFFTSLSNDIQDLINSTDLSKEYIQSFFTKWILTKIKTMSFSKSQTIYIEIIKYYDEITACESLDATIDLFQEFLSYVINYGTDGNKYTKEVNEIIAFIHTHYAEKITVEQIAAVINYSPNYLCTIFKKETKTSITEFINQIRIENAKQLLISTNFRNFEIALKVGFMNESYFANIFKKITGMTPFDFKKIRNA
jgi:two-component system response regulator YesN